MIIDLEGKTAVVTGSTEGIGYAIARGLASAGASLVVNGRSQAKVTAAVTRLAAEFGAAKIRGVTTDVGTPDGYTDLVRRVPETDILVSNAGTFQPIDLFEASDEVWDAHWQVNVMAGVRLSRAWLPGMKAAGWGRVIFIASEAAFNIPVEMSRSAVNAPVSHQDGSWR